MVSRLKIRRVVRPRGPCDWEMVLKKFHESLPANLTRELSIGEHVLNTVWLDVRVVRRFHIRCALQQSANIFVTSAKSLITQYCLLSPFRACLRCQLSNLKVVGLSGRKGRHCSISTKLWRRPILSGVQLLTVDSCMSEAAAAGGGVCANKGRKWGACLGTPICGVIACRIGMLGRSKFGIDFNRKAEHIDD